VGDNVPLLEQGESQEVNTMRDAYQELRMQLQSLQAEVLPHFPPLRSIFHSAPRYTFCLCVDCQNVFGPCSRDGGENSDGFHLNSPEHRLTIQIRKRVQSSSCKFCSCSPHSTDCKQFQTFNSLKGNAVRNIYFNSPPTSVWAQKHICRCSVVMCSIFVPLSGTKLRCHHHCSVKSAEFMCCSVPPPDYC